MVRVVDLFVALFTVLSSVMALPVSSNTFESDATNLEARASTSRTGKVSLSMVP